MISLPVLLMICVTIGEISVYGSRVTDDDPMNFKLTKLLDVKLESKTDSWKNDLSRLFHEQIDNNESGKSEDSFQIPMKLSFAVEKTIKQNDEKLGNDVLEGCHNLVGRSKIPLCYMNSKPPSNSTFPRSCREVKESGRNISGIYEIKPRTSSKPFAVLCDMETKGGGWTHLQKRFDGTEDFYLPWRDYKHGFGNLNGEFWIGLENIYHMTAFESNELLIELTEQDKTKTYAQYALFSIGPEKDSYVLNKLSGYSGNAGDALTHHLMAKFSTLDVDNDKHADNCAKMYEGAWWYVSCHLSNLNGKFMNLVLPAAYKGHGINWTGYKIPEYNFAGSRIMVRPIGE
ncbi:microfibril-associated glycoprotein 4-like isoform X1 [Diabrotica virgifera virgifera]|uniref:Microfibril-associated glycoprotein 4-like isoform X1 n=1 Tax=Diabrotica virgifera virgifera TaxID=50390 RepID=A0A6P7GSE8_DIAVI|nr:microfibril-associated glycoprotein 4-like isoform X1 [Diabrotica virgifera virgifera]